MPFNRRPQAESDDQPENPHAIPALRSGQLGSERPAAVADQPPWTSRQLHRLNEISASSGATAVAAGISAAFLLLALIGGHTSKWLTAFQSLAAAVTLVMVFALQHTQARQQAAVQRKLDELLRVQPGADQRLVHVESAHQAELDALAERHEDVREHALAGSEGKPTHQPDVQTESDKHQPGSNG
jgi:low affinity Fe/Cu permease